MAITDVTNTPPPKRNRVQHKGGGISRTRQADAEHTKINSILRKYVTTGVIPQPPGTARYGDFTQGYDFKSMMDKVTAAQSDFNELPSAIRAHVNHDVGAFLDLVMDPARKDELVELGMLPQQDPSLAAPTPAPEEAVEGGENSPETENG